VLMAMLGIQLANHLSQTSIFKDLQIGGYQGGYRGEIYNGIDQLMYPKGGFRYPDSGSEFKYYGMAWNEHVPY
jgi:hypothetical protein